MRVLLWLALVLLVGCLHGCGGVDWRAQLAQTDVYTPSPELVQEVRQAVRAQFTCPAGSTHAYAVIEVDLVTNSSRAGIRCQ